MTESRYKETKTEVKMEKLDPRRRPQSERERESESPSLNIRLRLHWSRLEAQ